MRNAKSKMCRTFFVVSCPGMGYAWLADTAFPKVQLLQRQHTEIKNWIVICGLGVNDLTSIRSYLNKYRRWPESSKLYLLSVNPTKSGAPVRCNNQRIEAFNNRIKKGRKRCIYPASVSFPVQAGRTRYRYSASPAPSAWRCQTSP